MRKGKAAAFERQINSRRPIERVCATRVWPQRLKPLRTQWIVGSYGTTPDKRRRGRFRRALSRIVSELAKGMRLNSRG